jgi:hypothetical protein
MHTILAKCCNVCTACSCSRDCMYSIHNDVAYTLAAVAVVMS